MGEGDGGVVSGEGVAGAPRVCVCWYAAGDIRWCHGST